jgi:sugar lactone lactonase YvrE
MTKRKKEKSWHKFIPIIASSLAIFTLNCQTVDSKMGSFDSPPRPKFTGAMARNKELTKVRFLAGGKLKATEDIAVDGNRIFTSDAEKGNIYCITIDEDKVEHLETFAHTGGMNLGLKFDATGNLIACNCPRGLLSIDRRGHVTVLCDTCDGTAIHYADDLDIAQDGKIYFSDASDQKKHNEGHDILFSDLVEGNPYGRLMVYDPATKSAKTLLPGLCFANGVAVAADQSYVLINESFRYRIHRVWLKGEKAGQHDLFAENLSGYPDGITTGDHCYWVSIFSQRSAYSDCMFRHPWARRILSLAPRIFWGHIPRYGMVLKLDENGKIVESLQDPSGKLWGVTNTVPWKNYLILGRLYGKSPALYDLSANH